MEKALHTLLVTAPVVLMLYCNFPPEPEKVIRTAPLTMKLVPGGTFSMGADNLEFDNNALPVHQVTLDSFYMDSIEVTQGMYWEYMEKSPAYWANLSNPVENITWFDAVLFCNARSRREHYSLDTVYSYSAAYFRETAYGVRCSTLTDLFIDYSKIGYRLPTEAEWEYACRAGTTTEHYWGVADNLDTNDLYCWFVYNSNRRSHPVAEKGPNGYGLYDMIGNVWEWCNDWYQNGYSPDPTVRPVGPDTGTARVIRGGAYNGNPTSGSLARSGARKSDKPEEISLFRGFRCVLPRK